jgi:nicotinamide phosphoribosyltransferase
MPMTVRGVPEGTVMDSSQAMVSVMATDRETMTIGSHFETAMQRSVWYMSTIASQGLELYQNMLFFYSNYSDNPGNIGFSLNDFGQRGATSYESAMMGGLGHLVYFQGTDNVAALRGARYYYNADIAGYSVPASEHSLQCSFGKDNQSAYLKKMLDTYAKPNAIVSIVLDGYDVYRESQLLCTEFKQQIIDSNAKVVFRPDSGDMFEVVPKLLAMQEAAFGFKWNSKGKKVINNVGIIQGDGINPTTAMMLMQKVVGLGYAPECVVLGSGGGLLQSVNRDSLKFAQKTSAMRIDGVWTDTVKDPITDPGKKSKGGIQDNYNFVTYYENGSCIYKPTWNEITGRARKF